MKRVISCDAIKELEYELIDITLLKVKYNGIQQMIAQISTRFLNRFGRNQYLLPSRENTRSSPY